MSLAASALHRKDRIWPAVAASVAVHLAVGWVAVRNRQHAAGSGIGYLHMTFTVEHQHAVEHRLYDLIGGQGRGDITQVIDPDGVSRDSGESEDAEVAEGVHGRAV
ncbi:MAG TPA: hypothetical protein VFP50_14335, partial [Anaeromyxobacteraceae bacterium]|nr:hypothetical protein [Anaeromyxobacteraceae bacterium]